MTKRTAAILVLILCLLAAIPAMAADVFKFTDQAITVYADEMAQPTIEQDGRFAEGTLVFKSANAKIFTVDETGTVTGVAPGSANLQAELQQNGKTVRKATVRVNVLRRVTKITTNITNLQVYEPDDETILPLLKPIEDPENPGQTLPQVNRILVLPAGKAVRLAATITPADVKNKNFTVTSSDLGILKVNATTVTAMQAGECDLTVASQQNPEITEVFHVLVTQPVKRLQITAPAKTVSVGGSLQLSAAVTPDNATIQAVEWSSRNEKAATVDSNGIVTGIARGNVTIEAKAADGSGVKAQIALTVTQDATDITIRETDVTVATGRRAAQLHVTVLPTNANNKNVDWYSSDETIATVRNGVITGVRAGECTVTCTSQSNPAVSASIPVRVIQLATRINVLNPKGLSFNVGETAQLEWEVAPSDTTIKDVTFRSRAPKIATVDANGIVTGLSKGQANIEINTTDGSGVRAVFQVNVIQPVTGIEPLPDRLFAQLYANNHINSKTHVLPRNANNQGISWSVADPTIATTNGKNAVYGNRIGETILTATTDDGGYTASTTLVVGDFDHMIVNQYPTITDDNKIKLSFGNFNSSFIVKNIRFRVDCYDTMRNPMVCNIDGESTFFTGYYPQEVYPNEWTKHGQFVFTDYLNTGNIGYFTVTVTGYDFDNDQKWTIAEEAQVPVRSNDSSHIGEPTPTPLPTFGPDATPAPDLEAESGNG